MNKKDLAYATKDAVNFDINKGQAEEFTDALLQVIQETLADGGEVNFYNFGKFSVAERSSRKGRNPQTGEEIEISASKNAKFKPAKGLKDAVSGS